MLTAAAAPAGKLVATAHDAFLRKNTERGGWRETGKSAQSVAQRSAHGKTRERRLKR